MAKFNKILKEDVSLLLKEDGGGYDDVAWYNILNMQYSLTYILVALLAAIGVDNADSVAAALITVVLAVGALYGRYRAGGINFWGKK